MQNKEINAILKKYTISRYLFLIFPFGGDCRGLLTFFFPKAPDSISVSFLPIYIELRQNESVQGFKVLSFEEHALYSLLLLE